jgi:hypothetical protein
MDQNARIGFHAASRSDTGAETGLGNALVGAYLAKEIGLPYEAIAYITKASPNSMTWLNLEDANKYGIQVRLIDTQTKKQSDQARARTPNVSKLSAKPGFNCARVGADPVRQILCIDQDTAGAYWALTSASWAFRFSRREAERETFDKNEQAWKMLLVEKCSLLMNQVQFTDEQRECVVGAFHKRAEQYRSQLSGDALAEAILAPEEHAEIQKALIELGLLNDVADGEFGPLTRSAIKQFQIKSNFPQSEFLTATQRAALLSQVGNGISRPPSDFAPSTCTIMSSDANLNVRISPRGLIFANLPTGTKIDVLELQNDEAGHSWARIATPIAGWVFAKYVHCSAGSSLTSR